MIEINLKTVDNTEIKTLLPNSWGVLTCKQVIDLLKVEIKNKPKTLEVLTGVDEDLWKQVPNEIMQKIVSELDFLNYDYDFLQSEVPKYIDIDNKKIKVPEKIELETWGQKLYLEELLKEFNKNNDKEKNILSIFPKIAAVYLMPQYYGKIFDDNLVDEFSEILSNQPALYVYPIAGFFLLNSITGKNMNIKNYNHNMKQPKFKLVLMKLVNLAILQR